MARSDWSDTYYLHDTLLIFTRVVSMSEKRKVSREWSVPAIESAERERLLDDSVIQMDV